MDDVGTRPSTARWVRRIWRLAAGAGWLIAVYGMVVRPWHLRWGATEKEVRRPLPGDELVATPTVAGTRAITIAAPPGEVWPWLVQQGYGRAGWYAYSIDNDWRPSPWHLVPELQHLAVGEVMPTDATGGFTVVALEVERYWVGWIDTDAVQVSVVQQVEPVGDGTRLLVRFRANFAPTMRSWLFGLTFDLGDFLFMRKEMIGIKQRAEALHHSRTVSA
jgi:hypothetical protein